MYIFESKFIKTDVTAVKFFEGFYLVGVGGFLHVFKKETAKLLLKINVFDGQKIYGIILNKALNKILLYGGRHVKILGINKELTKFKEISHNIILDWILSAKWINDDTEIATISMHNKLHIWSEHLQLIAEIVCEEKCILYSAFICYDVFDKLIILSGTVFSEILIWKPTRRKDDECVVLKRLQKHKGVIFSVHYNESTGYICSTSDDRSAIIWKIKNSSLLTELEQENVYINAECQVYGHLSRIFRCCLLNKSFITAGEDSLLNIWSFDGQLIRKIETHQGGAIWALDCDEENNLVLTGGDDCGVTLFPINSNFQDYKLSITKNVIPKAVAVLPNNDLVTFSENGSLYRFVKREREWVEIQVHHDLESYVLMVNSNCKSLIALAGFQGQIYIYKENYGELEQIIFIQMKSKSRILALHWLSCNAFLTCQTEGILTLFYLRANDIVPIASFILPFSKERWTTCAVYVKNTIVVGDRKGSLHLFVVGMPEAVQTLKRVHSHLGVTNLIVKDEFVISLGRNSFIKTFLLKSNILYLISSEKLPFTWLVGIVDNIITAFSGDSFIVCSQKTKRIIFDKSCGGGHRSWDLFKNADNVTFSYIKDKVINVVDFNLSNFLPIDLVDGYHLREINSLKAIKIFHNYIVISGGEDTTLRMGIVDFMKLNNLISLKSHLSSIRCITTYKIQIGNNQHKQSHLVFSAGGRAQIICWKLDIILENNSFKRLVCSEEHSHYKPVNFEESEMRIMDLSVLVIGNKPALFCACSDGNVKVFFIEADGGRFKLKFDRDIFYELKCVLKLSNISILSYVILVTMATDGKLVFWDVSNIFSSTTKLMPFYIVKTHQSGINSCAYKLLNDNFCLFLTGGDDNAIVLNLILFKETDNGLTIEDVDSFIDVETHCAQITGAFLYDCYFITTSIDQKVAVFEWHVDNKIISCKFLSRYNTSIPDLQGMECFGDSAIDIFLYGKGLEYVTLKGNQSLL